MTRSEWQRSLILTTLLVTATIGGVVVLESQPPVPPVAPPLPPWARAPVNPRELSVAVHVVRPDGQPLANVPLQYAMSWDGRVGTPFGGASTNADGNAILTQPIDPALKSIAVELGSHGAGRDPFKQMPAETRIRELLGLYSFRDEYRVAIPVGATSCSITITAEERRKFKLTCKYDGGPSIAFPGIYIAGYNLWCPFTGDVPNDDTEYWGLPKGKAGRVFVWHGSQGKSVDVPASTDHAQLGVIDFTSTEHTVPLNVTLKRPATEPESKWYAMNAVTLVKIDGSRSYIFTTNSLVFGYTGAEKDKLARAREVETGEPMVAPGKYIVLPKTFNGSPSDQFLFDRLKAGGTLNLSGVVTIDAVAGQTVTADLDTVQIMNGYYDFLKRENPLVP